MINRAAKLLAAPLTVTVSNRSQPAAVAILGAPTGRDRGLSPVLAERLAIGIELYEAGLADLLCLTGTARETDAMVSEAQIRGIPESVLVVDRNATNTRENAANIAAILIEMDRATVWVATQPFHSRRACFWFRYFGLRPLPRHRADSIQYDDPRRAVRWIAREYASWANLGIRMLLG